MNVENLRSHVNAIQVLNTKPSDFYMNSDGKLSIGGRSLEHQAVIDTCNVFKLQYGSLSGKKGQDIETAWPEFSRAVSRFQSQTELVALVNSESQAIDRILRPNPRIRERLDFDRQLDFVEEMLGHSGMEVQQLLFDVRKLQVRATFMDRSTEFNVLDDANESDLWTLGVGFVLGVDSATYNPAFLRLICENGMMAMTNAFQKTMRGFNPQNFDWGKVANGPVRARVAAGATALKRTPATLAEMQRIREHTDKESFDYHFKTHQISAAYRKAGVDCESVFSMPSDFLKRASSGVNAYDVFNYATNRASHDKEMTARDKVRLNKVASDMLFEGPEFYSAPPNPFSIN